MLQRLRDLLSGTTAPEDRGEALRVAVAVVLVEAARMDDRFEPAERRAIEATLARRFGLSGAEAAALLEEGARAAAASVQMHGFLRTILDGFDEAQRVGLIEMLWEVAYADGALDPDEDALIRRIAGLIYVSDRDRGEARRRVRQRLGMV